MVKLEILNLPSNNISGTLPRAWGGLNRLENMELGYNPFSGTLPPAYSKLTNLVFVGLGNVNTNGTSRGRLSGTLPGEWGGVGGMPLVQQLYLKNHRLSGTIPASWGSDVSNNSNLQVLAMQNNRISGSVPPALLTSPALCIVLLNNNRIRGRIQQLSPGFFRPTCTIAIGGSASSQFRPSLDVHNNRLSCALPSRPRAQSPCPSSQPLCHEPGKRDLLPGCETPEKGIIDATQLSRYKRVSNSLYLMGNQFETRPGSDGVLPGWVLDMTNGDPMALASPFLYLHRGLWWDLAPGATSIIGTLLGGIAVLAGVVVWLWRRKRKARLQMNGTRTPHQDDGAANTSNAQLCHRVEKPAPRMGRAIDHMIRFSIRFLALGSGWCLVVNLPLFIAGAHYYECGNALLWTTSAYLSDRPLLEGAAAASLSFVGILTVLFAVLFRAHARNGGAWGFHNDTGSDQREDDLTQHPSYEDTHYSSGPSPAHRQRGVSSHHQRVNTVRIRTGKESVLWQALLALIYISGLLLVCIPSFTYALTEAVPTELGNFGASVGEGAVVAIVLRWIHRVAPFLLALVNTAVIPAICAFCREQAGWQSSWMLLSARVLTTWVVPTAVVLLFSNSCGRWWLSVWSKCQTTPSRQELDVHGPSQLTEFNLTQGCYVDNSSLKTVHYSGFIDPAVLSSGDEVCQPGWSNSQECGRDIIGTLAPLLLGKMAVQAFLVPAATIITWAIAPRGLRIFAKDTILQVCQRLRCLRCLGRRGRGGEHVVGDMPPSRGGEGTPYSSLASSLASQSASQLHVSVD